MIKNVFNALKKRIEEVADIKAVYFFQRKRIEENDGDNPLFVVPSAHIEFRPMQMVSMTTGIEVCRNATIVVHIVCENLYDEETNEALSDTMDLPELVHAKLKLFAAPLSYLTGNVEHTQILFNSLHRTLFEVDHDSGNMHIIRLTYNAVIYDYDNMPTYTLVDPVNLNITAELSA
jgi:hypothetical protein